MRHLFFVIFRRVLVTVLVCAPILAQTPAVSTFFDDTVVQNIQLMVNPSDWASLQQNYQDNTYYHATLAWNSISIDVGIRSHGSGSRSPIKPNLDVNIAKYNKTQTFLGMNFFGLKANNEDSSNLHEWLSMKLFRKMGLPAPREAPANVFINGQLLGFFYIVEHEDETFLQRNFGESGGYLYEWQDDNYYEFTDLGTDPPDYAPLVDLKTNQAAPDLQNLANLVQAVNGPADSDDAFIAALSQYLNPRLFLTHIAIENVLSEADGICGGIVGMNNFYLYQFQNQTLYQMIAWDKDLTFFDPNRDIFYGILNGENINVLAQRLVSIPQYRAFYLQALTKAALLLGGTGGWADQELTREYAVIQASADQDPNKQCNESGVLYSCGAADFESAVTWMHSFLETRADTVLAAAVAGAESAEDNPSLTSVAVAAPGGSTQISGGALVNVSGANLGAADPPSGTPLPRTLGNTFVTVDGVRAGLVSVAPDQVELQIPWDIPVTGASIVAFVNGTPSNTLGTTVLNATPAIVTVAHSDGTAVSASNPPQGGEVLVAYMIGLGVVNAYLNSGQAAPTDTLVTMQTMPQVSIGDTPVTVVFAGLAPGYVGLYQLNVVVPDTVPSGLLSVVAAGQRVSAQISF